MRRFMILGYGVVSYALFFGVFVYAIGFLGNFAVSRSIDARTSSPTGLALAIDLGLLGLFAVQHSVMARPWFKRWLTRYIPKSVERSTYVLASSAAMILLFALWQPLGGLVWNVPHPEARVALYAIFGLGWTTIFVTTFLINHFDLFGLRQSWCGFRGQPCPPLKFTTPGPYRFVRHPLYVGWLMTFWAAPEMTLSHLVFAVGCTAYILVAIGWEENDLVDALGDDYAEYRQRVGKLLPRWSRSAG